MGCRALVVIMGLAGLAGCDRLFGLAHVDHPPSDANADADPTIDAISDGGPQCPRTYDMQLPSSISRYRPVTTFTTWDAAQIACAADSPGGTHLVVLDDDWERTELVAVLLQRMQTGSVWIGLTDRVSDGSYLWVTAQEVGSPPLTSPPWGAGQPDNQGANQDCVRIEGQGGAAAAMFDDSECSSSYAYVCECDGYAPNPANF